MTSEPSARISWWSRPTALCSASSRAEAVRADHLGEAVGLVRGRRVAAAAHFAEADAQAGFGELPGGFASGEAAADDVDVEGHGRRHCDGLRQPDLTQIHLRDRDCGLGSMLAMTGDSRCASSPSATRARRWPSSSRALQAAGVERVIDVRALPLSRRPGFSRSPLRAALEEAGIEYVHLKALGTPADGASAARAGRHADLERIYAGQLELPERSRRRRRCWSWRGEAERVAVLRARARALPPHLAAGSRRRDAEVVDLFA